MDQKKFLDKNEYFFDCKSCDKICCPNCSYNHKKHTLIKVNEKNNICDKHFKKFEKFCTKCKKNFCSHEKCKCKHEQKYQIKIQKPNEKDLKEIKDKRFSLFKKKELQELLIKLLDTLIETYEKHPFNYYNSFNISNIAKRIREMDNNKSNGIDKEKVLEMMDELENKINIINFDIEPMEEINLEHNKISDIEPIKDLNSHKLKLIDLSYNAIQDFQKFEEISKKDKLIKSINFRGVSKKDI